MRSSRIQPSWKQGFARNAAQSASPGLWTRLQGLWMPSLGPTGLTLHELSGRKNNGTLTNMPAADVWVNSPYGAALEFVRAVRDDAVVTVPVVSDVLRSTRSISIASFFRPTSVGYNSGWLFHFADGADAWNIRGTSGANTSLSFIAMEQWNSGTVTSDSVLSLNEWLSCVCTCDGTTMRMYLNGVEQSTTAELAAGTMSLSGSLYWGNRSGLDAPFASDVASMAIWDRALAPNEIQQLYVDPYALVRQRVRIFPAAAAAAPGGVAPTSHLYGPLVGPLGGAI